VTSAEQWVSAVWPAVQSRLPDPPARVVEIGCGPLGGFVPALHESGYEAVGVDPQAPDGDGYRQVTFEQSAPFERLDAVVASTSLHHVADPGGVVERIAAALDTGGTLVVVEWAWERFDERTAQWCFERLGPDADQGWLHRRRDEWAASRRPWDTYLASWAEGEGLHRFDALLRLLDERFRREHLDTGPYFFPDLAATSEEEEVAAIEAGVIRATRADYVGRRIRRRRGR
jgi:SAM-dependent methyltransferase